MVRILVIDDDPTVRHVVRRFLEAEGYEVCEAVDGTTALQVISGQVIDLVITDVYMPGMDGVEFASRLAQQSPRPKAIAMSGGGHRDAGDVLDIARRMGVAATLEKPVRREELLQVVSAVIAGSAGGPPPRTQ